MEQNTQIDALKQAWARILKIPVTESTEIFLIKMAAYADQQARDLMAERASSSLLAHNLREHKRALNECVAAKKY